MNQGQRLVWGCLAVLLLALAWPPSLHLIGQGIVLDGNNLTLVSLARYLPATTTTARGIIGALQAEKSARFTVFSQPAANSQASASIAAEAAVRHVADCITWSADASAAVTAAAGTLVLRDGATGAGTVIASWAIAHQVAAAAGIQTIPPGSVCGLNLVGTTNTAMTAEFNAGVTGEVQGITLTGFNVQ